MQRLKIAAAIMALAVASSARPQTAAIDIHAPPQVTSSQPAIVPQVPIAPPLPQPASLSGSTVDAILFGGFGARLKAARTIRAARQYQRQLADFVGGLSPAQYQAVMADPQQSAALVSGLFYLKAIREIYLTPGPPREAREEAVIANGAPAIAPLPDGVRVYAPSQCIGAIVNGECHGSIMPDAAYHPICHGQMLNGMCTGPMF